VTPHEPSLLSTALLPRDLAALLGASDRAQHRLGCTQVLEALRARPELHAGVVEVLRKGTPLERFGAAWVLFHARRPTLSVLRALLGSLELPDGDRRWEAVQMLVTLGRLEPQVAPVVQEQARRAASPVARRMALFALRELAPERLETERVFIDALSDLDPNVRRAALSSLVKLRSESELRLDRALEVLAEDSDLRMRLLATIVCAELSGSRPTRREQVRRALEGAQRADPDLAHACSLALRRIERSASEAADPLRGTAP